MNELETSAGSLVEFNSCMKSAIASSVFIGRVVQLVAVHKAEGAPITFPNKSE